LHQPDGVTPMEETLSALTELVREGKVRYIGCSNFDGWQVADASWTARTSGLEAFVSVQNRYSLLDRTVEAEVTPASEAVEQYAEARGLGVLDVAIAGLAAQPAVASVLSGATSGDQVRTNAAALRWVPTPEDLVELDESTG
jgi:aryl-alcohol dehydrogenase-like predicted oxidoreductase